LEEISLGAACRHLFGGAKKSTQQRIAGRRGAVTRIINGGKNACEERKKYLDEGKGHLGWH